MQDIDLRVSTRIHHLGAHILLSALVTLLAAPVEGSAQALVIEGPPAPQAPAVVSRDAEGRATIRAVRVTAPVRIDGALDDLLYTTVPSISGFIQVEPNIGEPATEQTEVWIAFDDDNVYVSFKNWDSAPERRIATEMRRDVGNFINGNDIVQVFIDNFYDRRNGLSFSINSIGARNDGQQVGTQYNGDWNPIWDHATGTFDGGWTVEMALPFRSFRYRPGREQVWGINVLRTVRWKNELSVLTPVPAGRGNSSAQYAALAAAVVGVEAPPPARNLDIKPYAISTLTSNRAAVPPLSDEFGRDVGLDVKYAITQNVVTDLTYNTDFAQVEADEQQINLTQFSLFFPEKREFFLENRDTFSFGGVSTGGDAPVLFYSRRIGLEAGRPVPLDLGGRLTGRVGPYTVGALNIQTDDLPATSVVPGIEATNFSVVRVRRDILRESSVGALATHRTRAQVASGSNSAYGVDGTFNFFNDLAINTYWARTRTEGVSREDTSYRAQLNFPGDRYGVQIERLRVGEQFNPEIGFVRRPDIRRTMDRHRVGRLFRERRRTCGCPRAVGRVRDRVSERGSRECDVRGSIRVHPACLSHCHRCDTPRRRVQLAEHPAWLQLQAATPDGCEHLLRAWHLLQRTPDRLFGQPWPPGTDAEVLDRANLLGEPRRARAGRLHHAPGRLPRHLRDVALDVRERAGAIQLGQQHRGRQRSVSLGVPAGQRTLCRV